ncbi:MAG: hypothetical protein ACE5ER_01815 [Nitrospinaceae bacterium]
MKIRIGVLMGLLVWGGMILGCDKQVKEAEERGRIPKRIVDNAKAKVKDVEAKMRERMAHLNDPGQ